MGVIHEDFVRCKCGCPDFKIETTASVRKAKGEQPLGQRLFDVQQKAICIQCGETLVL